MLTRLEYPNVSAEVRKAEKYLKLILGKTKGRTLPVAFLVFLLPTRNNKL